MGIFGKLFERFALGKTEQMYPTQDVKKARVGRFGHLVEVEVTVSSDDDFALEVVGESFYQENLGKIVGPRDPNGASGVFDAELAREDDNPYDDQAIVVTIDGLKVGHLNRADARRYRATPHPEKCRAVIIGGHKMQRGEWASYGVKLDLEL